MSKQKAASKENVIYIRDYLRGSIGQEAGIMLRAANFHTDKKVAEMDEKREDVFKLEIFIPESHFKALQNALRSADAGHLGNYDRCLSYSRVRGTWRPLQGAIPFIGEEGAVSEEDELKVEVNVRKSRLTSTLQAIRNVHPYEEPVINVILLYGGE